MPFATRSRRPWSARIRGVVAGTAVALVAGCGGPPEIAEPDLPAAQATACRDLVADLPDTLLDQQAVEVAGAGAYGAAWGDPALVLSCGVGALDLTHAPPCLVVDGVGWVTEESDDETAFTTEGYRPRVRVVVPDDYAPEASALTELASLVKRHTVRKLRCL